ncbi:MAG: hypothetical protein AMXMBFR48_23590 [Ignavibacteriales bacterium]
MLKRKFGRTGITVSPLGFGAGQIGDDSLTEREVESLLHSVLDMGINFIDTAVGYGLSEERIGKYLAHRRQEYILSTKVGYGIEGVQDWTYECIIKGVDAARKQLRTGVIDIVHLHSCSEYILRNNGVIDALLDCRERGWLTVAAYSGENEALAFALNSGMIQSLQTSVNLFDQKSLNQYIPKAKELGLGTIGKRSLANVCWQHRSQPYGHYCEQYWLRMQELQFKTDLPIHELVLRFAVYSGGTDTALVGGKNTDNIRQNIAIVEKGQLPEELVQMIKMRYNEIGSRWEGLI